MSKLVDVLCNLVCKNFGSVKIKTERGIKTIQEEYELAEKATSYDDGNFQSTMEDGLLVITRDGLPVYREVPE